MNPDWITPEEQVKIINIMVHKTDTLIHLGDVGNPEWIGKLKAGHKVLIMGNHDQSIQKFKSYFDEVYSGCLFISDKILLSHEPVYGLPWCLNIHGHDHNGVEPYKEGCKHINLAANVCNYTPINLGKIIKDGVLSDIHSIHRQTINRAAEKKINMMDKCFICGKEIQRDSIPRIEPKIDKIKLNEDEESPVCDACGNLLTIVYMKYREML